MPQPYVHELRVRYSECDPQGIVFNANYLVYFDLAFTELWRSALGPWQRMLEQGIDAVVAEANVRFRAPAHFDEQLQLHARLTRLGTTAITTEIDVTREGELLAQGMLRYVCVASDTWSKTDLPKWVHDGLERFLCPEAKSSREISSQGAGTSSTGA